MERRFQFGYDVAGSMLKLVGFGPRFAHLTVTPDALRIRMGWAFRMTVPRRLILRAEPYDSPLGFGSLIVGWGVHTNFAGTWFINTSQRGLVRIELAESVPCYLIGIRRTARTLIVGPDDRVAFLAALR